MPEKLRDKVEKLTDEICVHGDHRQAEGFERGFSACWNELAHAIKTLEEYSQMKNFKGELHELTVPARQALERLGLNDGGKDD